MADTPYQRGKSQRIIDDERKAITEREVSKYARENARIETMNNLKKAGHSDAVAFREAFRLYPDPDPKVMAEASDFVKRLEHPKESGVTPDGKGKTNYWTGAYDPFPVPDTFSTSTNAAGVPVQVSNMSGRKYAMPGAEPKIDTTRNAMIGATIRDLNKDEYGRITNSPANMLNQYDEAINPSPQPPNSIPSWFPKPVVNQPSPVSEVQIEMVEMVDPKGNRVSVPSNRVDELKAKGYR